MEGGQANKPAEWAMITGSSSGLGKALAKRYAESGFHIILHGRTPSNLHKLQKEILKLKVQCVCVCGNLEDENLLKKLIEIGRENGVKVLINNAAELCQGKPLPDLDQDYINSAIAVNIAAPIILIRNLINQVSNIININSVAGYERKRHRTIYCATKGALKSFSETLSLETDVTILDIYISKLKKCESDFGLEPSFVSCEIYQAFVAGDRSLVLDGRGDTTSVVRNSIIF